MPAKITTKTVSSILDNIALGSSRKIAAASKVSSKTVLAVVEAFPLWGFIRNQNLDHRMLRQMKRKSS